SPLHRPSRIAAPTPLANLRTGDYWLRRDAQGVERLSRRPLAWRFPPATRRPQKGGMRMATLSERDMRILAFERSWWRQAGAQDQAISDLLGVSATRSHHLLDQPI